MTIAEPHALFQQPRGVSSLPQLTHHGDHLTLGSYATEADAATALDAILTRIELWQVHSEVRGSLCHPRPVQDSKSLRIDRVLMPTPRLLDLGWMHGAVGIEIKRSGVKIGPPIAQAMDYGRAVWQLTGGVHVWLDWIFIWPMPKQGDTVESILAQNRIGSASADMWTLFNLQTGSSNLVKVDRHGNVRIGKATATSGRKTGSR